jgi:two-component sensor histidine kinase/PAS domain-containing protein
MPDFTAGTGIGEAVVATVVQPLVLLDGALVVESANPAFLALFRTTSDAAVGRHLYELGDGHWNEAELGRRLERVLSHGERLDRYRIERDFGPLGRRIMLIDADRIRFPGADDRIVLAVSDITERERLRVALEGQKEFAEKLIDSVREALVVLDWNLRVRSANKSFYDCFKVTREETEGRLIYQLGNGQWNIPELRRLLEDILPRRSSFDDYEVRHDFDDIGRRLMLLNARRLDHLHLIVLAVRDVTDRHRSEIRQRALMGELQHRVKNILSNVRALAIQTRRNSRDLDDFFRAFEARLGALARTQDLIVRSPAGRIDLREVVERELEAFGAAKGRDYAVDGPAVPLTPSHTQALALTVHELTTNAAKYGALLVGGDAVIEIVWRVVARDAGDRLTFDWRERGVRIDDCEPAPGFGTRVIRESLPHMLGGTVDLVFHPDGVACRLEFPLTGARDDDA